MIVKKIALAVCLYSTLSCAFAMEKPAACPDISLIKNTKFIGGIRNINGSGYIGAYQIDAYGTKELWEMEIAKSYKSVNPSIPDYNGVIGVPNAVKLARDILSETTGNPTPYLFPDKSWRCIYTTGAPEKMVIAATPLRYIKEE